MRILVVDDDPVIIDLLRLNFELEGHEVASAADGAGALAAVAAHRPDVVVLDIMMPPPDGFTVCEGLRQDPATQHLPIVLLTARAQAADRQRGKDVGASAYVTKPFDPLQLVELVESLHTSNSAGEPS